MAGVRCPLREETHMNESSEAGKTRLFWLGVGAFIVILILSVIAASQLPHFDKAPEALTLSTVILVGLALVVVLMVLLIVFYKVTGIEDGTQALGLPSGSVRALLAFCLVLMFVCLGVFLYQGVNAPGVGKEARVTQDELTSLQKRFSVVLSRPAPDKDVPASRLPNGTTVAAHTDLQFDVTYFPDRSKEADDFAKLIFTQLATVFVTVIGFYFGSSTAAAGVGAGVIAAGGATSKPPSAADMVPQALMEIKALAAEADALQKQAQNALNAITILKPPDSEKTSKATDALKEIAQTFAAIQAQVEAAKAAAAKYGTMASSDDNTAAANAILKAKEQIKQLEAKLKASAEGVVELAKVVPTPTSTQPSSADTVPAALMEAKAIAGDAGAEKAQAQTALDCLTSAKPPNNEKIDTAQKAMTDLNTLVSALQAQFDNAKAAAAKFGTASTDAGNADAAKELFQARDAMKPFAAKIKDAAASIVALKKDA